MKTHHSHFPKQDLFIKLLLLSLPFVIASCASKAIHESPTRWGYSAITMPGIQLGESKTSAHVLLAYDRIKFNGGGGHLNLWEIGTQVRQSLAPKSDENGFWVGGGISYLAFSNKYDDYDLKQTASGFAIGPIVGYRFMIGKVPLSFYLSPEYLSRGKFKTNGSTSGASTGSGFLGTFGFDIHWASMLSKKGR